MLEGELIPVADKCIGSFLNGDLDEVEEHFYEISFRLDSTTLKR